MPCELSSESFFSVPFHLVLMGETLPYDLYINSSSRAQREKYVRIFPQGGSLTEADMEKFKEKYHQLYILEDHRKLYLKSLVQISGASDIQKTEVIKDSAIEYLGSLFDEEKEFTTEMLNEAVEGCRDSVESMVSVINGHSIEQVKDLIGGLSFHDFYTFDHSINVSMYCISILKALKPEASESELTMAGLSGLLHDLGKTKISTTIINKPEGLTDEDFAEIKKHPGYGKELIEEGGCECEGVNFEVISRVVHEHHENYNGTGYPNQINGTDIHIFARITAIADFFDAITTKRSYHEVLSMEDAINVMAKTVGKKIDPKIFEVFSKNVANIVIKKGGKALPEDFDPCQPHNNLPLEPVKAEVISDAFTKKDAKDDYGTIKSDSYSAKSKDVLGAKKKAS
jgi:HD-GYP domain-containing protein (c-di-GMP phosphodiesterase class II)